MLLTCNWNDGERVIEMEETTESTRTDVLVQLTMYRRYKAPQKREKYLHTKCDCVNFTLDHHNCILASVNVNDMANFDIVNGQRIRVLMVFLGEFQVRVVIISMLDVRQAICCPLAQTWQAFCQLGPVVSWAWQVFCQL